MTTSAITCAHFSDRLMAYLEQETDDATRASLERHALSCPTCGPLLADLRELRVEAINLPELTPSRDLWAGIAARIEAPVVPIGTVRQIERNRSVPMRRGMRSALIAASLVAAAGVGYVAARVGGERGGNPLIASAMRTADTPAATQPESASSAPAVPATQPAVADAGQPFTSGATTTVTPARLTAVDRAYTTLVADYDREIARLRALLDQRRSQLDPVTVAIIERNLQVIDTAIAECKKAIARDPASRFLIESLNQSLQSKLDLMRTAALLPSRT